MNSKFISNALRAWPKIIKRTGLTDDYRNAYLGKMDEFRHLDLLRELGQSKKEFDVLRQLPGPIKKYSEKYPVTEFACPTDLNILRRIRIIDKIIMKFNILLKYPEKNRNKLQALVFKLDNIIWGEIVVRVK